MQYAIGKTFKHDGPVKACEGGLHSCEYPLDVFNYYPPATSRFAMVKASGSISREDGGDSKIASAQLMIEAEITIPQIVTAAIEWVTSRCLPAESDKATGYRGAIFLLRRDYYTGEITHVFASKVGENGIKAGVFYMLGDAGEPVEIV